MRHRNLVFAALFAIFLGFAATATEAQKARPDDEAIPNITGRVTDLAGRSIRHAEVAFFCLDTDEFIRVKTNAFGYYRVSGLTEGHAYMLAGVEHRRYLFLIAPIDFTVGSEILEFDFLGEIVR